MSGLVVPPDHVAAFIARLRSFAEIMTLCPDDADGTKRVGGRMHAVPDDWKKRAIVVLDAGGFGSDPNVPLDTPRVEVQCHAKQGHEAALVARTVIAALTPPGRVGMLFTEANCRIRDTRRVTGLIPFTDRETRTQVRSVSFEALKDEVPQP